MMQLNDFVEQKHWAESYIKEFLLVVYKFMLLSWQISMKKTINES